MRRIPSLLAVLVIGGALVLTGCDSTGANDEGDDEPLTTVRFEDLPADPSATGGGPGSGTGRYTFFRLRDSSIVLRYDNTMNRAADSSSTEWDLAFQATNVLVNGGASGPGNGAAYVAEKAFQEVTEVDTDRLEPDGASERAIPGGSGNGWYNYNRQTNVVSPLPGRTIVVRTADGGAYAKIRILSYYEGAPENPVAGEDESRYYTFEYMIQDDGTSFE
jgi:hypothetical protein